VQREVLDEDMTDAERILALRETFQDRVSKYSLELWTISQQEAELLLEKHAVSVLLPVFTSVGREVKRLREEQMLFLTQEEVLDLLRTKVRNREAKVRAKERHSENRIPTAKLKELEAVWGHSA